VVDTIGRNPFEVLDLVSEDLDHPSSGEYHQSQPEFISESPYVQLLPEISTIASEIFADSHRNTAQYVLKVKEWIFNRFSYQTNVTNVHTLTHEVLELRAGVCQDFSHLMIALCREAGVPARYVSGYLYLGDHHELRGTEATHAWVEALLPSGEWLGVDPTNDILADDRYVKVHVGRDYSDVTPVKGIYTGYGTQQMDISVGVSALSSV
jgi:transglutaminase-like putative cysteine protease